MDTAGQLVADLQVFGSTLKRAGPNTTLLDFWGTLSPQNVCSASGIFCADNGTFSVFLPTLGVTGELKQLCSYRYKHCIGKLLQWSALEMSTVAAADTPAVAQGISAQAGQI